MTKLSGRSHLTVVLVTLSCTLFARGAFSQQAINDIEVSQIQALLKQYEASIDAADTGLVDQIWSHSPEVIFIEPRGTEHGIKEVKAFVSDTFGKYSPSGS